jgi:hypothetical protein
MNLRQPLLGQYALVVLLEQRSRGVGATCTALKAHGRPKHMTAPEYRKIGAGLTQRRRLSVRMVSLAPQRPIARGFASTSTELAVRVRDYASTLEIRAKRRVFRGPGDRQAPISARRAKVGFRGEFGGSRARTALASGHATVGPSSLHAESTIGRLTLGTADAV